jgi:hypothetical protein
MTDLNKHNPYPESFFIRCPKCEGPSEFRFAFTLIGSARQKPPRDWPSAAIAKWGDWKVIQHDPALYPWKPPSGGYTRTDDGIRACPKCGGRFRHRLSWPRDAYFKCEVRGETLWAWTLDHARVLRDFIASSGRNPAKHDHFFLFLHHIPEHFLRAKNRDLVLKRLDALICQSADRYTAGKVRS